MTILLRSTKSELYFVAPGRWTSDLKRARDFKHIELAILFNQAEGMADMEVVVTFDDPLYNLSLPLQKFAAPPNPQPPKRLLPDSTQ